ncbi:hypothetical protein AB0D98_10925 [Streptomyces sp. NPDC047987]|uniref:hypothetical protein n=1 Tax=unclassified Streptomyces TaxID=2593676 RepID=UPI0034206557
MTSTTICAEYSTHTDRPPVGPCILRPGHLGHIHQDMRGIQWASRPDTSGCCICGGGPIVYHNYLGKPICAHCSNCECGERPCAVGGKDQPAGEGLQVQLSAALRVMLRSEEEIADLRAEIRARDKVIAQQRAVAQRALRDVAAVARVRDLADRWYGQGAPASSYARELLSMLDNAA